MICDSFFHQGITHQVCEDYALHGDGFAIISDGCSNGGGPRINSDWGARILCKSVQKNISILDADDDKKPFFYEVGISALEILNTIGNLKKECLSATIGMVYKTKNTINTLLIGDGAVIAKNKNGNLEVKVYEAISGAPFYLKYTICNESNEYFQKFGNLHRITSYIGNIKDGLQLLKQEKNEINLTSPWFEESFSLDNYESVYICSDGISSFIEKVNTGTSKHTDPVPIVDVLKVLLDGINYRNHFLQIQCNWIFNRATTGTFLHKRWYNSDDFSVAAINTRN